MDDPRWFLENVVRPNVAELAADYSSRQRAFNAAAALDALVAAIFVWCKENNAAGVAGLNSDIDFRHQLAERHPDYALVRDVAKALRHVELTRGDPQVTRASQVQTRSIGWGEARWGEGRYGGPPQAVVVTDAGETRVIEAIICNALSFIEGEMDRLGC